MKLAKMICLFMVCLLALSTAACGDGSSGTVSVESASDDQRAADVGAEPPPILAEDSVSEVEDPPVIEPPIISPAWQKIPDSRLDSVAYNWSPNQTPGYFRGLFAWSGGALDTKRNRLLIHGGGHADYGGQEIYAFDFDTFTWSLVADPDTYSAIDGDKKLCNYGGRTSNDYPKSVHTYDRLAYIESIDSLCDTRGAVGFEWCPNPPEMACYSFITNEWSWDFNTVNIGGAGAAGKVHPVTGEWWLQGAGGSSSARIGRYNPTTDTWEEGSYDNVMGSTYNKVATIDPVNNLFVLAFGQNIYSLPIDDFIPGLTKLKNYLINTSGDRPISDLGDMGFDFDPVSNKIVAWNGGANIYLLDTKTWQWSRIEAMGDAPPNKPDNTGTFGRFSYVESIDKFILVNAVNENVYLLDLRNDSPQFITEFQLKSSIAQQSTPFTTAVGFKKGEVAGIPTLDLDYYQVDIKKRWNDGSVKHAIFSGYYDSTSGQPKTVTVFNGDSAPAGIDLSEVDILAAIPAAFVTLGSYGSVNLVDLLESPDRIWLQGPEMIEAHYSADVDSDPALVVKFHVRLYAKGQLRIRVIVENGTINGPNEIKSYIPLVTIGGIKVYDNGGENLHHYAHTRWSATGWIGSVDPQITIAHDTEYMRQTKLVPNYWKDGPSDARLDELSQVYRPMSIGDWRENMGNAGYHGQIGLLPLWDALYINSGGDSRAYRSVVANAEALNSYPIVWSDPVTDSPIVLDSWATWSVTGEGSGGATGWNAGPVRWDVAHQGSGGYLAYLVTGDFYHLETMEHQAAMIYLMTSSARGSGTSRVLEPVQTRAVAWSNRSVSQLVSIAPSSASVDDFQAMLDFSMDHWKSVVDTAGMNDLGYFHLYYSGAWDALLSIFEQNFMTQSYGYISDLEPLADMTSLNYVRDHIYQGIVGLLGGTGPDNYCYYRAGDPFIYVTDPVNISKDPTTWFDSWGDVYAENWEETNPDPCPSMLSSEGSLASSPSSNSGYWANLLPSIAYAVEDGAPGAADAWNRLTGADNWADIENAGFENTPIWGIVPRGWE